MSSANLPLSSLVVVDAGFKPAVHLPDDFNKYEQNVQLIRTYIPTSQSIGFLAEVARSLNAASNERARMLHGTFGTGKSDLLLILCNYFSRPVDDPVMQPFYEKLKRLNEAQYNTIYQQRANKSPFLVVLLQANAVMPFPGFILHGLEQALKNAGLDDLMLPTRYAAACQKIEDWQREGHPVLQSFITALRNNEAKELSTLMTELRSPGADLAFPGFLRTFRAATGTPFDIYSYNRPEETYKRVAQGLRERGGYSGILIVCDEFTEVLRRLARASDQQSSEVEVEALGVQDLANASVASGQNQLHFIISSLEAFASTSVESTSQTGSKAVEKIGGRFKAFELQIQDSAELIHGAIQHCDTTIPLLPNRQHDELMEIARPLWRHPKQWVADTVVDGCFPLHPLVTYALPLLNRLVAQSNRTMFLFLKDKDGLSGFLEQLSLASPYPDWSNLLTLDWLFDYFEKSIQVRRSDLADAYNHSLQLLDRANVDTTLARRVLKAVAVCEVVAPALSPTRQLLRHALNLPPSAEGELLEALALLEQVEALYPPSDAECEAMGAYSLPMAGRVSSVNLRQRVIRKARERQTSVAQLQSSYPAEAIKAEAYNRRHGSYRELRAKYVSPLDLHSAPRLKDDLAAAARDGLLWYVIASSESERSDAQSCARDLTRQYPRLVIAVPTMPLTVLEALKSYEALQEIRSDSSLDSSARAYLQDTGLVGKGFHSTLTAAVTRLREEKQWEWFRDGVSQPNIINRAQVQDLASKVMNAVYPDTPEHQLAQHFKAEGINPSLTRAIAEILKGEVRISKSGSKPEDVILRTAMTGLGLLKSLRVEGSHETFSLVEPTNNYNSQKIWQFYQSHLSAGKSWRKLVETLREAPYGLYDSLIFAFTAAFFTFYADAIEITIAKNIVRQTISLDEKVLKDLINTPQNYNVRLQPLTEPEKQWLRGVVTTGLRMPFDATGGQGKTLRSRVAGHVKSWLDRQRLPIFAEKLQAEQVAALMPDSAMPSIAAAIILLQCPRTDEERIASALLKEIPEAFRAPANHSAWTSESVNELLAVWGETCRLLERLSTVLESHAIRTVANIFGCAEGPAEHHWGIIYQWRRHRQIVQNQVDALTSYGRTLFRLTNQPTSTIRDALLDEFARTVIGINTIYQSWPTIDHLERLSKELGKARDEIDTRWRAVANEEDVWHNGLASAALGRPVASAQADQTAQYLHEWTTSVTWPVCAAELQVVDIQCLYPSLDTQRCTDVVAILKRIQAETKDWMRELDDMLPRQFGIEGWTRAEVERAVERVSAALKHAANLDALLRKHTLTRIIKPFATTADDTTNVDEILRTWRTAHPIPLENDLEENARILLGQIDNSSDAETTLLITLPRALTTIDQSYQQWRTYEDLERYVQIVTAAVTEIDHYMPLTNIEQRWLIGVAHEALRRPLANPPREKRRLTQAVASQITNWLYEQQLPPFATTLTVTNLSDLFPDASPLQIEATAWLLNFNLQHSANPIQMLLTDLPRILGFDATVDSWNESTIAKLLSTLNSVCDRISNLNNATAHQLLADIGPIFGIEPNGGSVGTLVAKLRAWRQSYVLFPNETLSPDAAMVSEILSAPADDPLNLLLTTLPSKLCEIRTPYGDWHTWDQRTTYVRSLTVAAAEIAQRGHISDATPRVQTLWETFKAQIADLSRDEQRWLIKAFNEEFRT